MDPVVDCTKLVFITLRQNYEVYIKNEISIKLNLTTPNLKITFGIEKFNSKDIINLEFHQIKNDNDNTIYNFLVQLKQIEQFISRLSFDYTASNELIYKNYEFLKNIKGKQYMSCIRQKSNFNPTLRTHIWKNKSKNLTEFISDNQLMDYADVKGKEGQFSIELDSIWITDKAYGPIWLLKHGDIN